jgi:hypothetical protein
MAQSELNRLAKIVSRFFSVRALADSHGRARRIIRDWMDRHRSDARQNPAPTVALATRTLEAPQRAAARFSGPVADIPIFELVQTIARGRKDCVITVTHDGRESRIWCLGGEIVDAECGQLIGDLAFYRIVTLENGYLLADFRTVPHLRIIHASTQALLLVAARRKDECELSRKRINDTGSVYSPTDKSLASARHGRAELGLLRAFYPGATLDDVLFDTHLGDLEALGIVTTLIEGGWLAPNHALSAERLTAPLSAQPRMSSLRRYLVGSEPGRERGWGNEGIVMVGTALVVAVAVVWLMNSPTPPPAVSRGMPKGSSPTPSAIDAGPTARPSALGPVGLAAETPPGCPPELRIDVEAVPAGATLSLDGGRAAVGRLSVRHPRDGRTHELRIAAPGYETARYLFSEAPPPTVITLAAAADPAPTEPERSADVRLPRASNRRLPAGAQLRRTPATSDGVADDPRRASREVGRERPTADMRAPRVKSTSDEDPMIQTLDKQSR